MDEVTLRAHVREYWEGVWRYAGYMALPGMELHGVDICRPVSDHSSPANARVLYLRLKEVARVHQLMLEIRHGS